MTVTRRYAALRLAPALALAVVALLGLSSGCASLGKLAQSAFQKPSLSLRQVSVAGLDFEGATLAFDYVVKNPNGFGLSLGRLDYWLKLDEREVTRGNAPGGVNLPANGTAPVRFTARLPFAQVPRLVELVRSARPVAYSVGGVVGVDTPIGLISLPLSHSGTVDLPQLPAFRLNGVSVRMASLTDVELDFDVGVTNPNPFPFPDSELKYAVAVGGEVVATADGEELTGVAGKANGRIRIPVRLSLLGAGRAAAAAVRGGGAPVRLKGEAKLGALPVPLDLSGRAGQ